jgi:hypothetical protein
MKFIELAIRYQNAASTKEEAVKNFERSCNICCNRGLHLDCDRCQVSVVHNMTIAVLDDLEKDHK